MNKSERATFARIWNYGARNNWTLDEVSRELNLEKCQTRAKVNWLKRRYPELSFPPLRKQTRQGLSKEQIQAFNNMLNKGLK